MRVIGIAGVNRDLFFGPAAGVPARLHSELREHGIRASHIMIARIVVLGLATLQLDDVIRVHGHAAESVAGWNAETQGEKVTEIQNAYHHDYNDELALHGLALAGQL